LTQAAAFGLENINKNTARKRDDLQKTGGKFRFFDENESFFTK